MQAQEVSVHGRVDPRHYVTDLKAQILKRFRCQVIYIYKWGQKSATFHCQGEKWEVESAVHYLRQAEKVISTTGSL